MDITTARRLVANDQRESYPDMTDDEAIAHVVNTICLPGEEAPGAYPLTDYGDELTEAYRVVLSEGRA